MKSVVVLFGGASSEYEVSLSSAVGVLSNIDYEKYDVKTVGISREGEFYLFEGGIEEIRRDIWLEGDIYPLKLDLCERRLEYDKDGETCFIYPDCVLPMIHGKNCEDGTIQGMFSLCGIPVVGCDCKSSAASMDKAYTKAIVGFELGGIIRQAKAVIVNAGEYSAESALGYLRRCERELGYPMFVKPANAGSSVGVSKVKCAEEFEYAMKLALAEDDKVLIEEGIDGVEVEVAVLEERGRYFAAHPAEIDSGSAEFYDYETKYVSDASEIYLPARISSELQEEARSKALMIFKALGCRSLARVDFFCTSEGELIFNEINTLPGFTPISMYPKMMIAEGIGYSELIGRLIDGVC